ncbi:hypothetical protein BN1708_019241, partial [Verticillium longisporum]
HGSRSLRAGQACEIQSDTEKGRSKVRDQAANPSRHMDSRPQTWHGAPRDSRPGLSPTAGAEASQHCRHGVILRRRHQLLHRNDASRSTGNGSLRLH